MLFFTDEEKLKIREFNDYDKDYTALVGLSEVIADAAKRNLPVGAGKVPSSLLKKDVSGNQKK